MRSGRGTKWLGRRSGRLIRLNLWGIYIFKVENTTIMYNIGLSRIELLTNQLSTDHSNH